MRINESNATERSSEKTDHGSMRFGHIRDNVQAVLPNFSFFEAAILNSTSIRGQVSRRCCGLFTNLIES